MTKKSYERLFSHYPLFQLSLAYAAGVMMAHFTTIPLTVTIIVCGAASLLVLVLLIANRLKLSGLLLLASFFFAGASLSDLQTRKQPLNSLQLLLESGCVDDEQTAVLTGVLVQPPEISRDRVYLLLKLEEISARSYTGSVSGVVALSALFREANDRQEYVDLHLHYGTRVRTRTSLNRTDQFRNPGVSTLTEYLDRKDYDALGVIKNPTSVVRLDEVAVFGPLAWLYQWREQIQDTIDQQFSAETAGVLDAALLGNRHNLSRNTVERFREGGTFHVLVISGLHISFIGGLVFLLTQRLTVRRILQFVISNVVVWGYSVAVGAEASVVRAALMFTIISFGNVLFRSTSALNTLGAAALLLLVNKPSNLFDPSLQLTFLSVFAILSMAWPLLQNFQAIGSWRPTRSSPYPPSCARFLKTICEALYWSEDDWRRQLARSTHNYRIFKTPVAAWLERKSLQRFCRYTFSAIVVSFAVQIVLLPLLIIYFHRVSLSSVVLNIFVSILIAALGFVALGAVLISQLSVTIAAPLIQLSNLINWLMIHSVDPFSWLGVASLRIPEYTGWSTAIYLVFCAPLVFMINRLFRWQPLWRPTITNHRAGRFVWTAVILQTLLVAILILHPLSARRSDGKLRVDFLDVGQGDAALITMPDGTTLLVDGGGRPSFMKTNAGSPTESSDRDVQSIGERVVCEHLWWRGLDTIDYVLATHADADHIDGLNEVVRNFSVKSALVARTPNSDVEYAKFARTLKETKTHLEQIQAGDRLHFGKVTADVLWPYATNDPDAPSANNDSVVLQLQFGRNSILLTGDIEKQAETQILSANKVQHADVVKVPHHGSRTSSTEGFVKTTSPTCAIISVGQKSMFGHPHKEVVERWQLSGAQVLMTGNCGMITVTMDGKTFIISKFIQ